jgi:hypothetical protein
MGKYQSIDLSAVVNLGDEWSGQDEPLAGSRVKQTYVDKKGQYYIFKQPKSRREAQIWSELVASFIAGDLLGWPVQHTQIACRGAQIGNLLKFIYDPETETLIPGEQLCKHVDPIFDEKVGTRHSWNLIKDIPHKILSQTKISEAGAARFLTEYFEYWCKMIAFDTFISNTDRHAENWSVLLPRDPNAADTRIFAPMYDNASSMGCDVEGIGLRKWFDQNDRIIASKVESFATKGRHHVRSDGIRYQFEELATLALKENLTHRAHYEAIAQLDLSRLEPIFDEIMSMSGIPARAKMCRRRREQITHLLRVGQTRIRSALEDAK